MEGTKESPRPPDNPVIPNPATAPLEPPITPLIFQQPTMTPHQTPSIPLNGTHTAHPSPAPPNTTGTPQAHPLPHATPTYDSNPISSRFRHVHTTPHEELSEAGKSGRDAYFQSVVGMSTGTHPTRTLAELRAGPVETPSFVRVPWVAGSKSKKEPTSAKRQNFVRALPMPVESIASGSASGSGVGVGSPNSSANGSGSGIQLVFKVPPGSVGEQDGEASGVQGGAASGTAGTSGEWTSSEMRSQGARYKNGTVPRERPHGVLLPRARASSSSQPLDTSSTQAQDAPSTPAEPVYARPASPTPEPVDPSIPSVLLPHKQTSHSVSVDLPPIRARDSSSSTIPIPPPISAHPSPPPLPEIKPLDLSRPELILEPSRPVVVSRRPVETVSVKRKGRANTPPLTITTKDGVVHKIPPRIPYETPRARIRSQNEGSAGFIPGHSARGSGSIPPEVSIGNQSLSTGTGPAAKSTRKKLPESTRGAKPPPIIPHSTSTTPQTLPTSLQIFNAPTTTSLPTALREIVASSSPSLSLSLSGSPSPPPETSALPTEGTGDEMRKEAARGYELTRLRATRARGDVVEKTGVSASGKGVKVGVSGPSDGNGTIPIERSGAKLGTQLITKKKGKGKADVEIPNQDFCSSCRGIGKFLCCDGCPRSFHFMCLNPPLRIDELPEEETWYCTQCTAERNRDASPTPIPEDWQPRPIPMTFKTLVKKVEVENPMQFRLPDDIRLYFVGVGTHPTTGGYLDVEEIRMKIDRKGFQEDRETTTKNLRRNIACYVCGQGSLPRNTLATDPEMSLRAIVSCDYCALHWHLDCLDPPLAAMPNSGRKWMCPNHVEHVMGRRRTIRYGMETIDVERRGQPNNGNIQVLPDETHRPRIKYEEMLINKKKYRVPERIIKLDFLTKLGFVKGEDAKKERGPVLRIGNGHKRRRRDSDSSLTSMEGSDTSPARTPSAEDMEAANLVLSLLGPRDVTREQSDAPSDGSPPSNPSIVSLRPSRATSLARSQPGSAAKRLRKDSAAGRSKTGSVKDWEDVLVLQIRNGGGSSKGSGSGTREHSAVPSTASVPVSGIPKITLRINRPKEPSPVEKMVVDG